MSNESVYIAGAYEHPTREAPDKSTMEIHADVAEGALNDAGIEKPAVDGYCTAHKVYLAPLTFIDYLGLDVSFIDTTDMGGSSYISHLGHAAAAINEGKCDVVLVTQGGRPRSDQSEFGPGTHETDPMQHHFEQLYGASTIEMYAMAARRHIYEYGTTLRQLAEIRASISYHAQFNENALYQEPVSVSDVMESDTVAEPLRLLDCCVITDGGGAIVVVSEDVKESIDRECVELLGQGEAVGHHDAGRIDITETGAVDSGRRAYEEAGVGPGDIDYASIYDSFTITVLQTLEDLGFCEKGDGGEFVEDGTLRAPDGDLPVNTDGGGLCSNHPGNRGGMVKLIETVRQLRGEANPEVQVDADVALAHGTGGRLSTRHASVTAILGRCDR